MILVKMTPGGLYVWRPNTDHVMIIMCFSSAVHYSTVCAGEQEPLISMRDCGNVSEALVRQDSEL